jgi:hypothetical protein
MVFEMVRSIPVEVYIHCAGGCRCPKPGEIAGEILPSIGVDSDCQERREPSHRVSRAVRGTR